MKYFTKEYAMKKKREDCLNDFLPIEEEKVDSKEKIASLLLLEKEKRIQKARLAFDTPISMMQTREEVISSFSKTKYPKYDLYSKRIVGYQTLEEVLKAYDYQKEKLDRQFAQRGEFHPERIEKIFLDEIDEKISEGFPLLPFNIKKKVDPLLLALGYLPFSIYDELKNTLKKEKEETLSLEKEEEEEFLRSKIPEEYSILRKENKLPLIAIIKKENSLSLLFHFPGLRRQNSTGYSAFVFHQVHDIQKEEEIPISDSFSRERNYSFFFKILYSELRKEKEGCSLSLLLEDSNHRISDLSFSFSSFEKKENI